MKRLAAILAVLLIAMATVGQAAEEPIVIGFITALTGSTSLWGNQEANGAKMRVDEINAAGGVRQTPQAHRTITREPRRGRVGLSPPCR